jgi:hypothetical protein
MKRVGTDAVLAAAILGCASILIWSGLQLGIGSSLLTSRSYPDLLSAGAVVLGLVLVLWWLFGMASAFVGLVLHKSGHAKLAAAPLAVSPAFMKRLAAAALGINLLAVPAMAQASDVSRAPAAVSSSAAEAVSPYFSPAAAGGPGGGQGQPSPAGPEGPAVGPFWKPSAPPASPGLIARQVAGPAQPGAEDRTVTVVAGDSLWRIAARDLSSFATDAEIAGHWPKWYAANKDTIGGNPQRLLPGQVLIAPTD